MILCSPPHSGVEGCASWTRRIGTAPVVALRQAIQQVLIILQLLDQRDKLQTLTPVACQNSA